MVTADFALLSRKFSQFAEIVAGFLLVSHAGSMNWACACEETAAITATAARTPTTSCLRMVDSYDLKRWVVEFM